MSIPKVSLTYPKHTIEKHSGISSNTRQVSKAMDSFFQALIENFPLEQNPILKLELDFEIKERTYDWIKVTKAFYYRLITAKDLLLSCFARELRDNSLAKDVKDVLELKIEPEMIEKNVVCEDLSNWAQEVFGFEDKNFSINDLVKMLDTDLRKLLEIIQETISKEYFFSLMSSDKQHINDDNKFSIKISEITHSM